MPTKRVTFDAVWKAGATLPGVQKSTAYGSPALKVKRPGGKSELLACVPTNKAAEPGSLLVRIDRRERAFMVEDAPDIYYVPDHYAGYDGVLVRMDRMTPELIHNLLATAYRFVTRRRSGSRPLTH
ncbi:MAG TPA: hypothetical protein VN612_04265 [Acidobacteriaceae bacterium]|nr:hypothetical protein [Acidobacteriaceae bacterium]